MPRSLLRHLIRGENEKNLERVDRLAFHLTATSSNV